MMSEPRRILSLAGLRDAFPDAARQAAAERAAEKPATPVITSRTPAGVRMNSARPIPVAGNSNFDFTKGIARKPAAYVDAPSLEIRERRDFRAAMADANFQGIDPARIPVPDELLSAFKDAKSVLLVGHINPDHDTVGGTLTLARALRQLGKRVDICIDDELSHTHKRFAEPGEIKRASELGKHKWDLAVVVDVASSNRIGDARDLLKNARSVACVDHHEPHDRDDLDRRYRAKTVWQDEHFDAASVQVCAITERLFAGTTVTQQQKKHIYGPALAGMCTDTAWGRRDGLDPITSNVFKNVAAASGVDIGYIEGKLRFDIPKALRAAIDYQPNIIKRGVWGENRRVSVVSVNRSGWNKMLEAARSENPSFAERDLMQVLKSEMPTYVRATNCCALIVQQDSSTLLCTRSSDGRARELAGEFRGAGHRDSASANIYGVESFDAAVKEVERRGRLARLIA